MTTIGNELPANIIVAGMILLSKDLIKGKQDDIRSTILDLDKEVHDNAVQCMMHGKEFGDTSLMRRLLIDTLGTGKGATGYRTQGLINWLRMYSPMELKGDTINLQGILDAPGIAKLIKNHPELAVMDLQPGQKRPWLIEQANSVHFTKNPDNAEKVGIPIFQQTAIAQIDAAVKKILEAANNTLNGEPIDVKKAFYKGVEMDKVVDFAEAVRDLKLTLPKDSTLEVYKAKQAREAADDFIKANEANVA